MSNYAVGLGKPGSGLWWMIGFLFVVSFLGLFSLFPLRKVSKTLFAEYLSCKKRNKPFKGLGLEHMNSSRPVLPEDLGKAFTEKAILQTILDAEAKLPASSLNDVLGLVRSMYALICLEEDPSLLRYGYLSRDNVGDVKREVSKLCGEIRPHALALVTSFGIPDAFLGPIAFNWVEANAWS